MKPVLGLVGAVVVGAFACGANSPIGPDMGTGAPVGGAGTTGVAGTGIVIGAAGTTGAAGTGLLTGVAGTTGAAAVGGTAGTNGTTGGCASFGSPTLPSGKCAAGAFRRNGDVCKCETLAPNVCGDQCVDILTDDNNCGCCGQACGPTSTCNQGKCGPPAVEVVPASPGCQSIELAVAGPMLYWTDKGHGRVSSIRLETGRIATLTSGMGTPTLISVAGSGAVFWQLPAAILRSVFGGPPQTVVMTPNPIHGFVVSADGASVYYSMDTVVMRAPTSGGGTPVVVAREERGGLPMALALDGNLLAYPTDLNGDVDVVTLNEGKIASCGAGGPNGEFTGLDCMRAGRSQGSLLREKIVLQPGRVLWADGGQVKMSETKLGSLSANTQVTSAFLESISGFAATPTTVYFSERVSAPESGGVIYKAPIARDQMAIRIARGQHLPRSVVVDDKRVYWSTADCTIMSTGL